MSTEVNGVKDLTKWAIIERASYTASGFNEILYTFRTRQEAKDFQTVLKLHKPRFAAIRIR